MKKNATIADLKRTRDSALEKLCPILSELDARHEDIQKVLTGCRLITAPVETAVETLIGCSDKLYSDLLKGEAALYEKTLATRQEQKATSRFGLYQAVVPVVVGDQVQCCLRTGWMITEPVSENLMKALQADGKIPEKDLKKAVSSLRIYTKDEELKVTEFLRQLCDLLTTLLNENRRADSLAEQLISSERARSLGALTGGVAHHFNSLLSVILGYSSFMLNRLSLPAEASDALQHISDAAQKGRRLTDEMLAFLGSESEEQSSCSVHEILENVVSLLHSQMHSRVRFEMKLGAGSDEISARPSALHQVVFNLLTNTLDAIEGSGSLSVMTRNSEVSAEGGPRRFIEIGVEEKEPAASGKNAAASGENLPPEKASLKLSSLFGLVADLEGSVMITPAAGGRPVVKVVLPVAGQAGLKPAGTEAGDQLRSSSIWVLDDDDTFREMCEFVLSGQGHKVHCLSSAQEMKDEWGSGGAKPDLIVMDFSMPDLNGLEMCQWLRRSDAETPVILVSGLSTHQPDIQKATALKRVSFLQKPFTFREMTDAVEKSLAESLIGRC
ncbi:MAG: response regulator [Kiritimatiellia bacterium]